MWFVNVCVPEKKKKIQKGGKLKQLLFKKNQNETKTKKKKKEKRKKIYLPKEKHEKNLNTFFK